MNLVCPQDNQVLTYESREALMESPEGIPQDLLRVNKFSTRGENLLTTPHPIVPPPMARDCQIGFQISRTVLEMMDHARDSRWPARVGDLRFESGGPEEKTCVGDSRGQDEIGLQGWEVGRPIGNCQPWPREPRDCLMR